MRRNAVLILMVALLLAACNMPRPGPDPSKDLMGTVVAATLQALTPQVTPTQSAPSATALPPTPAATPTAGSAKVSGRVCYHDSGIAQLTLYFENTANQQLLTQTVSRPTETYSIDLPGGSYKVYGWPPDYTVGVLVKGQPVVVVAPAKTLSGIDFCDYSQGPFAVPYPPGVSPSTTQGSVAGNVYGYPGSGPLTVVAFNQVTHYWFYVMLQPGETAYSISGLPAGTYQVVAYDTAGNTGGTAPNIKVVAGQGAAADIHDWSGTFPANPVP